MSLVELAHELAGSPDSASELVYPSIEDDHIGHLDEWLKQQEIAQQSPTIKYEEADDSELFHAVNPCMSPDLVRATTSPAPQPWRKGLWCLNQKPECELSIGKVRKGDIVAPSIVSPAHLVVNDNHALRSPRSVTSPTRIKNTSPTKHNTDMLCYSQEHFGRDMTHTPVPLHNQYITNGLSDYVDSWQQDFQNFNLATQLDPFDQPDLFSVKTSQRFVPLGRPTVATPRAVTTSHQATGRNMYKTARHPSAAQELSSVMQANTTAINQNMFLTHDASFQFINEEQPGMPDWTSESQHSSSSSHQSQPSLGSRENHLNSYMHNTLPPQMIWSPPTTHMDARQVYASREQYPLLVQPKPRHSPHKVLKHEPIPDDMVGMAITTDEIGMAIPYQPQHTQMIAAPPMALTPHSYQPVVTNGYNGLIMYPSIPPPMQEMHMFTQGSPFGSPQRRGRQHDRTPSPPLSPTGRMPRAVKQRSPSRPEQRSKSISRKGPILDNDTRRHRSASRGPKTPKTPKTPRHAQSFANIDFVNFTPQDASKLLSDVAPSGSSKTRARREQEQRDKRKKLGEVARHAVAVAGGDVERFEREVGLAC